jgi:hypothetical protein
LWAVIALVVSSSWTRAEAQTPPEGWDVVVAPYLMGAAMDGATTLRGQAVDIDLSASDIFSNLQFGAMGLVVARKGNWGFGGDAIWMALGTTVRNTNVDFNQGAFAFYGLRRLGRAADLTLGLRVNTLQGNFEFKPLNTGVNQDRTWVDPVVGVILRTPGERRVHLRLYGEVGGFGAGSDISWQVFPVVGIRLGRRVSLEVGYRWLDIHYATGQGRDEFAWDVLTQGPVGGLAFRF